MKENFTNSIQSISGKDFKAIKEEISRKSGVFLVELDGSTIQSWKDYVSEIEKKFMFPTTCINSVDRYLDWIRDLSWLEKEEYILVIYNSNSFLIKDLALKNKVVMYFKEAILPFWQSEVEEVVVGGKAKPFMVYLID